MSSRIIVKVTIDNNRYMLVEAMPNVLCVIAEYFTYDDMSDCFMGGSFRRENVKRRKFLITDTANLTQALMPIGFKKELEGWLIAKKATYKFFDKRKIDSFSFSEKDISDSISYVKLHDYQIEAVKRCLEEKSGIIMSATGSGKSEMIISLCKLMNKKTLILFARIDLAHQTLRRMKSAEVDAGIVQGNNIDEDHLVVMATVQSAHKLICKYEVVICDETHRASADQYQDILAADMFKYRFGFSATPWTKDKFKNAKVKSWIGDEIYKVDPKKLIIEERIAKPIIHMYPVNIPRGLENYKWMGAEKHGIILNKYRNKLISRLCENMKGQILILIKKIDHGKELNNIIPNSKFIYGESKKEEREDVIKRFDEGEQFVLIASTILDEGIDIRHVNNVLVAGGGSSFVKTLQRIGRGTRITETKKHVDIHDFWDDTNPILLKQSRERQKIYQKYGFDQIIFHEDSEVKKLLL